ncbi:AMP-binding protein [Oricola sp.]|uniref:AMP-binding protein n=1 Tax=Oricola sp. TaxID=1979950 RepID=UPI0025E9DB27|nr:AMP-binding protein [Oricola sp.]MCI5074186.1 AMP-binding protein [Oricola sp.]
MVAAAHLSRRPANYRALTPLDFLDRACRNTPDRPAVVWRDGSWSYREFGVVVARLKAHLAACGVKAGDVVSVMCGNRPEMLAAHFAVPALGAVLNAINTRLDAGAVAWILEHAESRHFLCDPGSADVAAAAAAMAGLPLAQFSEDGTSGPDLSLLGRSDETVGELAGAVADEWTPIALNYTSGTTGSPKGVVLHHRGAYLNALGNIASLGLGPDTRYLWTLPMFHCNGWCHTWAVTAAGGVHVCLDKVDPALIIDTIARHDVTHMSCAPVVLYMILGHEAASGWSAPRRVTVASGGAAPTSALIGRMDAINFNFIHLYGLTECYGPTSLRRLDESEMALPAEERARLLARQGVSHLTANMIRVLDDGGSDVPADGATSGEIALTGNTLMAGYHRDADSTHASLGDGFFRTGDIAVMHPTGEIEIRDRAKDIIISGGENISSLEIESVLHMHDAVGLAAVVARPDPKWGEVPCAFVEVKAGHAPTVDELIAHCRANMAHFKAPKHIVFCDLPKTATGKIQKFKLREQAREEAAHP